MNGIRLTPFLLFVILLVVLIFAMLFGSSSKAVIQEGMDSEAGTFWTNASSANYNSMTGLSTVYSNNDANNNNTEQINIYFNPSSGSVIIPTGETNYTLLTRGGAGSPESSDTGQVVDSDIEVSSTVAPWSYSPADKNYSIIYCPYDIYTLIIVINTNTNTISQVFRNYQAELNGSPVSQVGVPSPNNAGIDVVAQNNGGSQAGESEINIEGTGMVSVNKIADEVYYSDEYGITVGQPGSFQSSEDFKTRITKLNNGSGGVSSSKLIIGTMIETRQLLIAIIKKSDDGNYMILSNNHIETAEEADQNDSLSIGLEMNSGEGSGSLDALTGGNNGSSNGSGNVSGNGSNGSNVNNNPQSCNSQYQAASTYTCPNGTDVANNPDYIKKTEVVPPVCPGCPPCPVVNPDNCSLSINSNGEIVDCTGKKYEPDKLMQGSSPGSWSGSLGEAVGDTAQAVGDVAEKGIDTVGDVADKTLDTASGALDTTVGAAGDALNTTVDAAGNIVGEVGDTIGDLAGGLGEGVAGVGKGLGEAAAGLGTGASNLVTGVTGDVAGLGNNLINSTTGLVGGAGEGISNLAVNEQLLRQQQQLMQGQQGYGYQQQQGIGYAPQYGYGYPMQPGYGQPMQGALNQSMQPGYGYSYPQPCPRSSSNFMPVTNDFSQFT